MRRSWYSVGGAIAQRVVPGEWWPLRCAQVAWSALIMQTRPLIAGRTSMSTGQLCFKAMSRAAAVAL